MFHKHCMYVAKLIITFAIPFEPSAIDISHLLCMSRYKTFLFVHKICDLACYPFLPE